MRNPASSTTHRDYHVAVCCLDIARSEAVNSQPLRSQMMAHNAKRDNTQYTRVTRLLKRQQGTHVIMCFKAANVHALELLAPFKRDRYAGLLTIVRCARATLAVIGCQLDIMQYALTIHFQSPIGSKHSSASCLPVPAIVMMKEGDHRFLFNGKIPSF